jgi:hypothetical protein
MGYTQQAGDGSGAGDDAGADEGVAVDENAVGVVDGAVADAVLVLENWVDGGVTVDGVVFDVVFVVFDAGAGLTANGMVVTVWPKA